jgi:hypothetical protein
LLFLTNAKGQTLQESDTLRKLVRNDEITHQYVNFDVLKILIGNGFSVSKEAQRLPALSWNVQILWPYARFRTKPIHLAYGISFGRSAMGWKHTEVLLSKEATLGFQDNQAIDRAVLQWNIFRNRLIYRLDKDVIKLPTRRHVKRFSLPLNFQSSWTFNQSKTISIGLFGSYDLIQRFKGAAFDATRQANAGISGAVIF